MLIENIQKYFSKYNETKKNDLEIFSPKNAYKINKYSVKNTK